nr:MAG TPA: hypothetical protein [Caudoviricetes sp.]
MGQNSSLPTRKRASLPTTRAFFGPFWDAVPLFCPTVPLLAHLQWVTFAAEYQRKVPAVPFGPLIFLLN